MTERWAGGEPDRRRDPDQTDVLPAYPGGLEAATDAHPTVPAAPPPGPSVGGHAAPPGQGGSSRGWFDATGPAAGSYGWPSDATVEQPRVRGPQDYPGGIDETHPLPRVPNDLGTAPPYGQSFSAGGGTVPPPSTPAPEPPPADDAGEGGGRSVARHGAAMALGSVTSRITGFVRTAAIGAAIGAAAIGDDYSLANTLPGMVYELLLGGVLASTVVPLLVRARDKDPDRGQAYAQRLLSLAVLFLAGATVVAVLCAPLFTALLSNDLTSEADRRLITTLAYLLLPMIFFYGMAALFAAVLNTRGHFAMPTFAPILNNTVVIAMCGTFLLLPIVDKDDAGSVSNAQIAVLGLGTTLGILVQAAGLVPALRRVGFRWKWRWDFRALHLSDLARVSAWMLVYVALGQLAQFVVFKLALMAADAGEGAAGPAIYNNAFLIFMMAHGIIAVSIITVLMPRMSAAAAQHRNAELAEHLSLGTRLTSVLLVAATVGYVILGRPLAVTLFEWGNYHHAEALDTGWVIAVAGLGLIPFAISQLQLFAFYAMRDTKTPAMIILPVVLLRISVDVLLYVILPPGSVAAGLMVGNAVSYVLAATLGYGLMRRRLGDQHPSHVSGTLGRVLLAGLIAAVPTAAVVITMSVAWGDGKLASFVQLVVGGLVLGLAYLGAASWLRIREVRELVGLVRAKLGR
jgi:putative peptidoglycan lipid II flippase